jgi:hypothetical protein
MIADLPEFNFSLPCLPSELAKAADDLRILLPEDYSEFLTKYGSGEGFIGSHYCILWHATELAQFNSEYEFFKYAPQLVAFASNGGGEAFAFDIRAMPFQIVQVPFIGMSLADAKLVASGFSELIERMQTVEDSLWL